MSTLREAAQQALAFTMRDFASLRDFEAAKAVLYDNLRAALAQKDEPVWMHPWPPVRAQQDEPCPNCASLEAQNTELDRKLAELEQAYEAVYRAGQAHEREECAKLCEARFMGDLNREDMEARRCAAAIRARGEQP